MHEKAATLLPHTTNVAQKSSNSGASDHQHRSPELRCCTKKQQRCYLTPPTMHKKAAIVVLGGSRDVWSLMETSRFPLFDVTLAGSRPGGRPTSLRRQRSRQERRLRRTGRLLKLRLISRLPCAAHNRRPAQNSRAAPAQTAAPDFPACCSAAQRFGRGFQQTPSLYCQATPGIDPLATSGTDPPTRVDDWLMGPRAGGTLPRRDACL